MRKFLVFKVDENNMPDGSMPDMVIAETFAPRKGVAVTMKPAEVVNQRQAFNYFVGMAVEKGEVIYRWNHPTQMEFSEVEVIDGLAFGSMALREKVPAESPKKASKKANFFPTLFSVDGGDNA